MRLRLLERLRGSQLLVSLSQLLSANAVNTIVTLATSLVVARLLGPVLMGHLGTTRLVAFYLCLSALGVAQGMGQRVPVLRGQGDEAAIAAVRASTLAYVAALCALFAAVAALATPCLWWLLADDGITALVVGGGALFAMATVFSQYVLVYMNSDKQFRAVSLSTLAAAGAALVTVPLAALGLAGATARLCLVGFAQGVAGWVLSRPPARMRLDAKQLRETLAVGLPIFCVSFLFTYSFALDRTLVRAWLGAEALGHYTIATLVVTTMTTATSALIAVIYPHCGELYGRTGDARATARAVLRPLPYLLLVLVIIVPAAAWAVAPVVRLVLPAFAPGIPAAQIAVIAGGFSLLSYCSVLFNVVRRQRYLILFAGAALPLQAWISWALWRVGWELSAFIIGACVSLGAFAFGSLTLVGLVAAGAPWPRLPTPTRADAGVGAGAGNNSETP